MIKNYFLTAWRNLTRNRGFALTNLASLTIGITCTLLILLWVQSELSWDKYNKNYDRTYQVYANRDFNGNKYTDASIMLPLADALKQEIPQVKYAAFSSYNEDHIIIVADKKVKQSGYRVSKDYFNIFSIRFVAGNAGQALGSPGSIVLSSSTAKSLFGKEDALGETLLLDNEPFKVTAVVEDVPSTSTISFDYIVPFEFSKEAMLDWRNAYSNTFVQMQGSIDEQLVNKAINDLVNRRSENTNSRYFVHPMSKWRLYGEFVDGKNVGGLITYVRMTSVIALVILLIACINFMNLSTARSEKRAREVGIRKTLGSGKKQLMLQFFSESILLVLFAYVISLVLVTLLLPAFNNLLDRNIALRFSDGWFWLMSAVIILITGLVAGSYPAIYLSSFNPVRVLKGTFLAGRAAMLPRRILVVGQFVISILLISSTVIIYQQLQHVKNRDLGYNTNNLIMLPTSDAIVAKAGSIKNQLLQSGDVYAMTLSSSPVTDIYNITPAPEYAGKPDGEMLVTAVSTAQDFTKTIGVKMIAGTDFAGTPADSSSMLLNRAAVKKMGLRNPVGTAMRYGNKDYVVKGVTEDIVMASPYRPVEPMIMFYRPNRGGTITIRLNEKVPPQQAIKTIGKVYSAADPSIPFEYQFVDESFNRKFVTEELIGKITNIFAALAIFICCLGMAGLASFTIEKRSREISVRKVLGASVQQLLLLIAREFMKLVTIAFLIAVPVTWWAMTQWLNNYEYRVSVQGWVFALVGILILGITIAIVWLNIARIALANPVNKLRD